MSAPTLGQVYLPVWRRAYDRAYAQTRELSIEREHLVNELHLLQSLFHKLHPRCSMKCPKGYNNSNSLASSSEAAIWYHGGTNFDRTSGGSFIATG
ncbi:hypothetical protein Zm00014a_040662 [Zea mays]|uniref:Uncharacterized protein n=1 Tax=Zea mays TaxID=4577 RepID=A0A3L6FIG1_MAIZE|nr:hypothetical protein Zm00014a_040662 [Zea mays]